MSRYYDNHDWDNDGFPGEFVYGDDVYIPDGYMDERWKPLDPQHKYWISDHARVWSSDSGHFLKVKPMDDHGHLGVCLYYDGLCKYRYIHRLVAENFIPNPDGHPIVRHLNDRPCDNERDNLAWGTQKDNIHDAMRNGTAYTLSNKDRRKSYDITRTPILATHLDSGRTFEFYRQGEAGRLLGIPQANIWKVLNGHRPHAGGYYFEYNCDGGGERD